MLLTGTHPRTLDDKNRLALPKKLRDQMGEAAQLYVTPGQDQSLWVYTQTELERVSTQLDQQSAADANGRVFRRLFFAQMEAVDVDKAGRILIPERLAQFAGLKHELVLLGVRDRLEIWDAERWQSYMNTHGSSFDAAAEKAFERPS